MADFIVHGYEAVIKDCEGNEYAVKIGVMQTKGVPFEAYWDSWIDLRIYFYMYQDDLDALKIGSEVAEGDILVSINRDPLVMEATYDPERYTREEGVC